MRKKKVLSLLTAGLIAVSALAGCGSASADETSSGSETVAEGADSESASVSEGTDKGEVTKFVMAFCGGSVFTEEGKTQVEAALNEILEEKYNVNIELRQFQWGTYAQEMQLALSGDEQIDILPVYYISATSFVNSGLVLELSDYLEQYGTNVKGCFSDGVLHAGSSGDFLYGLPRCSENITQTCVMFRKDILEEAGYTVGENDYVNEIQDLDDLTECYEKVYALHPEMKMIASLAGMTPMRRCETFDGMGSDQFGVLMDKGQSTTVVNLFETDEFLEYATYINDWYNAGYISSDAITSKDSIPSQMRTGNVFSFFTANKATAVSESSQSTGCELARANVLGNAFVSSNGINFVSWGLGRNCSNPELAFQVLDEFYGNKDLENILTWGVEGVHYQVIDEENGTIDYADGVNGDNTTYDLQVGWEFPNQELAYVWTPNTMDVWKQQRELQAEAVESKALGFTWDSTVCADELTACTNVYSQYYDAIGAGVAGDPAEAIKQMNDELYAAGLQTIIDTKQQQLDEWLAKKNN